MEIYMYQIVNDDEFNISDRVGTLWEDDKPKDHAKIVLEELKDFLKKHKIKIIARGQLDVYHETEDAFYLQTSSMYAGNVSFKVVFVFSDEKEKKHFEKVINLL